MLRGYPCRRESRIAFSVGGHDSCQSGTGATAALTGAKQRNNFMTKDAALPVYGARELLPDSLLFPVAKPLDSCPSPSASQRLLGIKSPCRGWPAAVQVGPELR